MIVIAYTGFTHRLHIHKTLVGLKKKRTRTALRPSISWEMRSISSNRDCVRVSSLTHLTSACKFTGLHHEMAELLAQLAHAGRVRMRLVRRFGDVWCEAVRVIMVTHDRAHQIQQR